MKQYLVKLELEELPENTSGEYWDYMFRGCLNHSDYDKTMREYEVFRRSLHACEIRNREVITPEDFKLGRDTKVWVEDLLNMGYEKIEDDFYGDDLLFEKAEIYKYSDEVKDLLDKLTLGKTQKIDKLENDNKRIHDQLVESVDKLLDLEDRVAKASFWGKVKYLFGGKL